MDTLTHALSGALAARATAPRPEAAVLPPRTRLAVGFWAAAFPDGDFVLRFIDPLTYLTAHRGVTHSIVLLPIWAAALALLFHLLYRRRYPWQAFVGVCALSIGVHIAGDVITSFGTMILAPLSEWRAQIPAIFIIDPLFTGIIAAGLLASWYWRARLPARIASAFLVAYVSAQIAQHARAVDIGEAYVAESALTHARAHALPQPFSPFHWMLVVEQPESYRLAYLSFLRDEVRTAPADAHWLRRVMASYRPLDRLEWRTVPRFGASGPHSEAVREVWRSEILRRYRGFAMFPAVYRVDRESARLCVWFNDLRFALVGRTVPFRFGACRDGTDVPWRLFQLTEDGSGSEVLHAIE